MHARVAAGLLLVTSDDTAVMFFAVTFPLMKFAGYMENRIRRKGYAHD